MRLLTSKEMPQWNPDDLLWLARKFAVAVCEHDGAVTADDVRILFDKILGPYWSPGNWMGSIFKDKRFEPTGGMVQARHKKAKGRLVRQWKLNGQSSLVIQGRNAKK